jgi:anti-sigma B factor antagonist
MSTDLVLSTTRQGQCAVVSIGGEVDLATANELGDTAVAVLKEIGPYVVLDFSGVSFMDSTGLKVLLGLHRRAKLAGGQLVLANPSRSVQKVIKVTGLDQTFTVRDTVEAAVDAVSTPAPEPTTASD